MVYAIHIDYHKFPEKTNIFWEYTLPDAPRGCWEDAKTVLHVSQCDGLKWGHLEKNIGV